MLRDLPPRARWYILFVIALGALTFSVLVSRATFTPLIPLVFLVVLSSLTSAFKIQFPIASGSNMSVSYVVDIAALILRGPHAAMIVGAASGWSQTTLNSRSPNPVFRSPEGASAAGGDLLLTRVHLTPASSGVIARDSRAFATASPRRSGPVSGSRGGTSAKDPRVSTNP